jgi:hypothetical protein
MQQSESLEGDRAPSRDRQSARTKLIWVIGDDTSVGKTFISAGLIRLLNALGMRTVGFKPYAGAALREIVDLLDDTIDCTPRLFAGSDVRKIAAASPLTPESLVEVVNPSWRIHHPARAKTVLVRKGSTFLGDRRFLRSQRTDAFYRREDIRELKLPFDTAEIIEDLPADSLDGFDQGCQGRAFAQLQALEPDVIVCEGAGRLLPMWEGCPILDHLLLLAQGDLHVFPNIRLDIRSDKPIGKVPTALAIAPYLKQRRSISSPIPILGRRDREGRLARFLERAVASPLGRTAVA